MLKLATLIQNPGEPPVESRYNDPGVLAELGYTGQVIYETTALSGVSSPQVIANSEMQRWVAHHFEQVQQRINAIRAAGLDAYLSYDALVLAADLVERYGDRICCRNRPTTLCPASNDALNLSAEALVASLEHWPDVAGVVLRFGDTDASRLPHLIGNDIYQPHCPRCSRLGRADRILNIVRLFHQRVVEQMNRRLIIRAWNLRPNGLHDAAELTQRVICELPGEPSDDRLMLSFKFTQTDFWRYQRWNQSSLQTAGRPVIYELQCQREFEGKGAVPNYQLPLWQQGQPEMSELEEIHGLSEVSEQVNVAGVWAWVRGGGWGGPFVRHEQWIDTNVFAVPRLAEAFDVDAAELARSWVSERLGVEDRKITEVIVAILLDSPDFVRDMFYIGPFARQRSSEWHPNGDWIQDDVIDVEAAWRMIQRVPESQLTQVVSEKSQAAATISRHRAALQQLIKDRNHPKLEPLLDAMIYSESLVEMLRDLLAGLVAFRLWQRSRSASDASLVRQKMLTAQNHWNHHSQRHGALPGASSSFRESGFWDVTQRMIAEVG